MNDKAKSTLSAQERKKLIETTAIVHQVVMIPCKYCGALMDQLVTVCPNCGAKRTG